MDILAQAPVGNAIATSVLRAKALNQPLIGPLAIFTHTFEAFSGGLC